MDLSEQAESYILYTKILLSIGAAVSYTFRWKFYGLQEKLYPIHSDENSMVYKSSCILYIQMTFYNKGCSLNCLDARIVQYF